MEPRNSLGWQTYIAQIPRMAAIVSASRSLVDPQAHIRISNNCGCQVNRHCQQVVTEVEDLSGTRTALRQNARGKAVSIRVLVWSK